MACRSGNRLSVVWLVKPGKNKGPYVAVYNHSTSTAYFDKNAMAKLFRRPVLYLLGALLLLVMLGGMASFFYFLLPVAVGFWLWEGVASANRFKKEFDFHRLGDEGRTAIGHAVPPALPA